MPNAASMAASCLGSSPPPDASHTLPNALAWLLVVGWWLLVWCGFVKCVRTPHQKQKKAQSTPRNQPTDRPHAPPAGTAAWPCTASAPPPPARRPPPPCRPAPPPWPLHSSPAPAATSPPGSPRSCPRRSPRSAEGTCVGVVVGVVLFWSADHAANIKLPITRHAHAHTKSPSQPPPHPHAHTTSTSHSPSATPARRRGGA